MKTSTYETIELELSEKELITILRANLDSSVKLRDLTAIEPEELSITHMQGKPYVFRWKERHCQHG